MTPTGWIKAWRSLFDRDDWMRPTKRMPACYAYAWLDLCQMAQHDDGYTHKNEVLNRGEFVASQRTLAARWGWSQPTVSRYMNRLQTACMIASLRESPHGTVYRVVKYDTYADASGEVGITPGITERIASESRVNQEQELRIKKLPSGVTRARGFPDDFEPTDAHRERATKARLDLGRELAKFSAHAEERDRKAKSWNAAFTRWLMNAEEYAERDGRHRNGSGAPVMGRLTIPNFGEDS